MPIVIATSNPAYGRWLDFDPVQDPAFFPRIWTDRLTASEHGPPTFESDVINDLEEAGYRVLRPIPFEIRRIGIGDFEASFSEANISISGSDMDDAYQALVAEILDTFDLLPKERKLGPDAAGQLRILRTYIATT